MNALGARIRLVKGAYREPRTVAHQHKSDVDAAYMRLAKRLLTEGTYPAIATHDEDILNEVKRFAAERRLARRRTNSRCCTASDAIFRRRCVMTAIG